MNKVVNPRGVVANVLDCDIVRNGFGTGWAIYVHFRTNILGIGTNPTYPPGYGLIFIIQRVRTC